MLNRIGPKAALWAIVSMLALTAMTCLCYLAIYINPQIVFNPFPPPRQGAGALATASAQPGAPTFPPTWTPTATATPTDTPLPTDTPTVTPTRTNTPIPTFTPTSTPMVPTAIRVPATATPTATTPAPTPTTPPTSTPYPYEFRYAGGVISSPKCDPVFFEGKITGVGGEPVSGRTVRLRFADQPPVYRISGEGKPPGEWGFAPLAPENFHSPFTFYIDIVESAANPEPQSDTAVIAFTDCTVAGQFTNIVFVYAR